MPLIYRFKQFIIIFILSIASISAYAQTCNSSIEKTAPDARYDTETYPGEVIDNSTGLIWERCSVGQTWDADASSCEGTATTHNWAEALLLTSGDWRLPNIKELSSLVETACYSPSINITVFPDTFSSGYWSSSPYALDSYDAWVVYFSNGYDDTSNKYNYSYVRLVRSGQ